MHEAPLLLDLGLGCMSPACILAMWDNPTLNQLVEPPHQLKSGLLAEPVQEIFYRLGAVGSDFIFRHVATHTALTL